MGTYRPSQGAMPAARPAYAPTLHRTRPPSCLIRVFKTVLYHPSSQIAHQPTHKEVANTINIAQVSASTRFSEIECNGQYIEPTMDRSLDEILAEQDQVRLDAEYPTGHTAALLELFS